MPIKAFLAKRRQRIIDGVGNEAQRVGGAYLVDELLWLGREAGQFAAVAKNKEVIAAWNAGLVVNFLANQGEKSFLTLLQVTFHILHQHVVIRDDKRIHARFQARAGKLSVCAIPVGVDRVHMQGNN